MRHDNYSDRHFEDDLWQDEQRSVRLKAIKRVAWRGWTYRYMKKPEEVLNGFERAIRLNPLDPMLFDSLTGVGSALIVVGRDEEVARQAKRALALDPRYTSAHRVLAEALAHLGRELEAKDAAAAVMAIEPLFTITKWTSYGGHWQRGRFLEGLPLAGLPE